MELDNGIKIVVMRRGDKSFFIRGILIQLFKEYIQTLHFVDLKCDNVAASVAARPS